MENETDIQTGDRQILLLYTFTDRQVDRQTVTRSLISHTDRQAQTDRSLLISIHITWHTKNVPDIDTCIATVYKAQNKKELKFGGCTRFEASSDVLIYWTFSCNFINRQNNLDIDCIV